MLTRRRFLETAGALPAVGLVQPPRLLDLVAPEAADADELRYTDGAHTSFGDWWAEVRLSPRVWTPGSTVKMDVFLHLSPGMIPAMQAASIPVDALLMLATSERTFDPDGWLRLPGDERMSTLLTPTGLAIEGGNVGAITRHVGSRHKNPVDILIQRRTGELLSSDHSTWTNFTADLALPADLPPGIYRLRLDFGVLSVRRRLNLNGEGFAYRPRYLENRSLAYSPPTYCSGTDASGRAVDAAKISPRIYWVLLTQYNSNGYRGVVAEEDRGNFAISDRNIIQDEVILPLYDSRDVNKVAYDLEPAFQADTIDEQRNVPWDYTTGELSIQVTDPEGVSVDLGTAPFKGVKNRRPTTGNPKFTAWKPSIYGRHTVVAKGWIADRWGNRYQGGGTYRFWIAKRLTLATATFQGQSYPVGFRYGRDIAFAPAVPAQVKVKTDLYPNSDRNAVRSLEYGGTASAGGVFGASQGMKPFVLDAPGEYHAVILATYTDPQGHLWICTMRHAGVVYPTDSPMIVHGKKLRVGNQLVDRGESHFEGYIEPNDDFRHLDHIHFPYNQGDVLLIASEGVGANKIVPTLIYELKGSPQPYDARLQSIGNTNVRIETSNGFSPHLYPEYITDLAYYYGAGPRPGVMARFLVGEEGIRGPYWPTSSTNFGGQFGASNNGDMPGTIYRLIGGVVLRRKGQQPLYGGYMSSAFILPGGTNNNRVVPAGSEDMLGADGRKYRFFLVAPRLGMLYEQGASFVPAFQIDPIVPARIRAVLRFPDGSEKAAEGTGDASGGFAAPPGWALEQPGVYSYFVESSWNGHPGHVPGLPEEGGNIYVIDKTRPQAAQPLTLNLKAQQSFSVADGLTIEGRSTGDRVYFAAVTPGCMVDQGSVPVEAGKFRYRFDPEAVHQRVAIYETANVRTGRTELGRIIHLTFFSKERAPDGTTFHSYARVILRGTTAVYAT